MIIKLTEEQFKWLNGARDILDVKNRINGQWWWK